MQRIIAVALVMMASPAFAQNVEPQCFEVVALPPGAPSPAILVDKCTGETWIFVLGISGATDTWEPINRKPYPRGKN